MAREGMELLVNDAGFLELVGMCSNAMEANKVLAKEKADLIFLDIQMPGVRGIDFLKSLSVYPLVIITTAYPNFALEGFELNVLDYLVKPITPERFLKSVNRAKEVFDYKQAAGKDTQESFFFIKCSNGYEKINYTEILYIEACQNYCCIYTTRAKFITLTSMKSLEEHCPAKCFCGYRNLILWRLIKYNPSQEMKKQLKSKGSRSVKTIKTQRWRLLTKT
jgi:DNA-binding LytR/AlgR family response regulator